jgi:hypothetical protein
VRRFAQAGAFAGHKIRMSNIAAMNASGAKWQLITTYNEWGEGTAIESSSGCRVTPGGYCDWSAGGSTSEPINDLHNAPPA